MTDNSLLLKERISFLADRQSQQIVLLKEQVHITFESLKPIYDLFVSKNESGFTLSINASAKQLIENEKENKDPFINLTDSIKKSMEVKGKIQKYADILMIEIDRLNPNDSSTKLQTGVQFSSIASFHSIKSWERHFCF